MKALLLGLLLLSVAARAAAPAPETLRVGLWTLWHDRELTLSPAPAAQPTLRRCAACSPEPLSRPVKIRTDAGGKLTLDGKPGPAELLLTGPVLLEAHNEKLRLEYPLRVAFRDSTLSLAVTLPVETYVERVVASESGPADSDASLQALAIVVRSFALHLRHNHADYDLCDSTHCQLLHWGANSGRESAAHAATLVTAGETLWFHGHRAQAWFHQNCGGRTAAPSEIWPSPAAAAPMPWLESHSDNWCSSGGAREWSAFFTLAELTQALSRASLARPGWTRLSIARRTPSGRAAALRADNNEFSAEDFRLAVGRAYGWGRILSDWFEIAPNPAGFAFHGRGSGHGVGLCQAGSATMAAAGRTRAQILAQYFPGAEAADEAAGKPWQQLSSDHFAMETLTPEDAARLPALRQALAEAQSRSGLQPRTSLTLRAFPSTPAFRAATLAPGWVAAFTEGNFIAIQPLRTLAARGILPAVLRHEFLHALIEQQSGPQTPLWLREGLVELWAGDAPPHAPPPTIQIETLDRALDHPDSERDSAAAHRAAAWYASRLLASHGRDQLLAWLRTGLPAGIAAQLRP